MGSVNEINIQGNGNTILDADNSASLADHTDFGNVGNSLIPYLYPFKTPLLLMLTISSITMSGADASSFTPGGISLPTSIAGGSSATFTVNFIPTTVGMKTADSKYPQ